MRKVLRVGTLLVVFGLAFLLSNAVRTGAPFVLTERYIIVGPGSVQAPNTTRLTTVVLPPQLFRLELTLNSGLGLHFEIRNHPGNLLVFALTDVNESLITWPIPMRSIYNITVANPHPVFTLAWIRITIFGIERDLFLSATIIAIAGIALMGTIVIRNIRRAKSITSIE